jgi:predicted transcriptional regulator
VKPAPETRNLTLALPKDLLHKVKVLAVERNTSVSRLLAATLEDLVGREENYARARQRHLAWLDHGADLGFSQRRGWTRDSLHER